MTYRAFGVRLTAGTFVGGRWSKAQDDEVGALLCDRWSLFVLIHRKRSPFSDGRRHKAMFRPFCGGVAPTGETFVLLIAIGEYIRAPTKSRAIGRLFDVMRLLRVGVA